MALANLGEKVLVWLHGRRIGLTGDGMASGSAALVIDNVPVATTRAPILICQAGKNGAGALTLTGTAVGDNVIGATNLSTPGDATSSFEGTITVANQIQQSSSSNLSGAQILFSIQPQS